MAGSRDKRLVTRSATRAIPAYAAAHTQRVPRGARWQSVGAMATSRAAIAQGNEPLHTYGALAAGNCRLAGPTEQSNAASLSRPAVSGRAVPHYATYKRPTSCTVERHVLRLYAGLCTPLAPLPACRPATPATCARAAVIPRPPTV